MNQQEFEESARAFLRREPFQPFVIELQEGRVLLIDQPALAYGGGTGATFLSADFDLVEFLYEDVRAIREGTHEMSS
jgi:hypothetical protein